MQQRIAIIFYSLIVMALISGVAPGCLRNRRKPITRHSDHESKFIWIYQWTSFNSIIEKIPVPALNIVNFESTGEDATKLWNILNNHKTMVKAEANLELHYPYLKIKDNRLAQKDETNEFTSLMVSTKTDESLATLMAWFSSYCLVRNSSVIALDTMELYPVSATNRDNKTNSIVVTDCANCVRCHQRSDESHADETCYSLEPKLMLHCKPMLKYLRMNIDEEGITAGQIVVFAYLILLVAIFNICLYWHYSTSSDINLDKAISQTNEHYDQFKDYVINKGLREVNLL